MGVSEEELRIILSAKDRASKEINSIKDALTTIRNLEIVKAAQSVFGPLLRVFKELAADALVAVGAYERLGLQFGALAAGEQIAADSSLSYADAAELSRERAEELLRWTRELALASPFSQETIAAGLRLAMVYGVNSKQAQALTQALVDYAAGTGLTNNQLYRLSIAMAQVAGAGKLTGQELRQFTNAGFGVAQIAQIMEMEVGNVRDAMKEGEIPADKLIEGFIALANERFPGAAARLALSWGGMAETMKDIKDMGLVEIFGKYNAETGEMSGVMGALQPVMATFVDKLTSPEFVDALAKLGEVLGVTFAANIEGLADALPRVVDAMVELVPALMELTTPGIKDAWDTLISGVEILAGLVEISAAMRDLVNAILDIGPGESETWTTLSEAFKDILDWATPLDDALELVATAFKNIAKGIEIATDMWNKWKTRGGATAAAPTGRLSTFQGGGMMTRAGLALVGERGPELLHLPAGARVSSTKETERILEQGPSVTFAPGSIVINAGSGRGLARQVETGMLAALRAAGMPG